jgi:3-oxoacyl-[acyl-carrier protein] reductase
MSKLQEKTALVTGASRGIGRAIAERLARDGALVAVNYAREQAAAAATVAGIEAAGGRAFAVRAELGTSAETDRLFAALDAELIRRTGTSTLDVLVNNAAIGLFATLPDTTDEQFDEVFRVNLRGPFLVTRAALHRLPDGGRIVNISSGASTRPVPALGAYSMTKGALNNMTVVLAADLGPRGITVNTVAPGWTITDGNATARADPELVRQVEAKTALGRFGQPADIAAVVAFLASPDSAWVTGQCVGADGGYLLPVA